MLLLLLDSIWLFARKTSKKYSNSKRTRFATYYLFDGLVNVERWAVIAFLSNVGSKLMAIIICIDLINSFSFAKTRLRRMYQITVIPFRLPWESEGTTPFPLSLIYCSLITIIIVEVLLHLMLLLLIGLHVCVCVCVSEVNQSEMV